MPHPHCANCSCCLACKDSLYPPSLTITLSGFASDATGAEAAARASYSPPAAPDVTWSGSDSDFNDTYSVPMAAPCFDAGSGENAVTYQDEFTDKTVGLTDHVDGTYTVLWHQVITATIYYNRATNTRKIHFTCTTAYAALPSAGGGPYEVSVDLGPFDCMALNLSFEVDYVYPVADVGGGYHLEAGTFTVHIVHGT